MTSNSLIVQIMQQIVNLKFKLLKIKHVFELNYMFVGTATIGTRVGNRLPETNSLPSLAPLIFCPNEASHLPVRTCKRYLSA